MDNVVLLFVVAVVALLGALIVAQTLSKRRRPQGKAAVQGPDIRECLRKAGVELLDELEIGGEFSRGDLVEQLTRHHGNHREMAAIMQARMPSGRWRWPRFEEYQRERARWQWQELASEIRDASAEEVLDWLKVSELKEELRRSGSDKGLSQLRKPELRQLLLKQITAERIEAIKQEAIEQLDDPEQIEEREAIGAFCAYLLKLGYQMYRQRQMSDPDIVQYRPYRRLSADGFEPCHCTPHDCIVLLWDDPFWS